MTSEELNELDRLYAATTPGPWWVEVSQSGNHLIKYRWDDVPTWLAESSSQNPKANFDWIAATHNAAPRLIATIGEQAMEIAELREELAVEAEQGRTDGMSVSTIDWISVADRLPKIDERVLIAIDDLDQKVVFVGYRTRENWWIGLDCISKPTHWMPLPEAPKG